MSDPTRNTTTTDGNAEITETVTEYASLNSVEATQNAKGHMQIKVKLYGQNGDVAKEIGLMAIQAKNALRETGFTIAGDSS